MPMVITDIARVGAEIVESFATIGVATIHEAQGRKGLLSPALKPIYRPVHIVGPAVTCTVPPGDNWMLHVAVEQCRPDDILVVAPTSPCEDGYFGEMLACSLRGRGVRGLVIDAGVRDVSELTKMKFPVWSRAICAQGTVKKTLGDINLPVVCGGQVVAFGDLIAADDDGIAVVRRQDAAFVLEKPKEREIHETQKRKQFETGQLGLDVYRMREGLAGNGLVYVKQNELEDIFGPRPY